MVSNIVRRMGLSSVEIVKSLQSFAPLTLAENWDNVGVLVDPMNKEPVEKLLLTNDLTEDVVEEAVSKRATFIVTYHPNIFQGLKRVTSGTWKERLVVLCIKHNITVFSPHTSWDSVENGVNDWLSDALPHRGRKPIKATPENNLQGVGRLIRIKPNITIQSILDKVKIHIGIPHLRIALGRSKSLEDKVEYVALCAGSGGSVLANVNAEVYLTGEMQHHDILDATQRGVSVILCNHSDSERGFLRSFQTRLQDEILGGQVEVIVSELDRDPLSTV